jgi:hypothetical protein
MKANSNVNQEHSIDRVIIRRRQARGRCPSIDTAHERLVVAL